ncbi:unnamed protein product [Closterium sp. NIES-54]
MAVARLSALRHFTPYLPHLDEYDTYLVEYTLQKPSEPCIHLYSAVATGQNVWYNNLFTFTGQYPEDEAAIFKPTVDKIVKSFRVTIGKQ